MGREVGEIFFKQRKIIKKSDRNIGGKGILTKDIYYAGDDKKTISPLSRPK